MSTPYERLVAEGRGLHDLRLATILHECGTEGWDSYGADPLTWKAVLAAKALVDGIAIVPTVNGGVNVSWANEGLWIEFDDEGHICSFGIDAGEVTTQTDPSTSPPSGRSGDA